jgi:hypothetical protein
MTKAAKTLEVLPPLPPPRHQHPTDVRGWYAMAKHNAELFVPLAVLQTFSQMADADGLVRVDEARREINPAVMSVGVRMLQAMGYIDEVGAVTMRIAKLPVTGR